MVRVLKVECKLREYGGEDDKKPTVTNIQREISFDQEDERLAAEDMAQRVDAIIKAITT